ncbi:MAG: hypothetical protein ABI693_31145, partial [Bryobacteraceae bacterium]
VGQPTLSVTPSLSFSADLNGSAPPPQAIQITGTQGLTFTTSVAPVSSWLTLSSTTGTVPATINASVNPAGLALGTYNATVSVTAPGATARTVAISLLVSDKPVLTVAPNPVSFTYQLAGTNPAPQQVTISSAGVNINYTLASDQPWLTLSSLAGTTNGSTIATVVPGTLPAGTYTAHIIVTAAGVGNSPLQVPVTLTISSPATTLSATPNSLTVAAATGSAAMTKTISVTSTQAGGSALTVTSTGGSWLAVTPATAASPATLTVTLTPGTLTSGTYTGSISVAATGSTPLTIPVTLKLTSDPAINAVTDGAAYDTAGFAPGSIISIWGVNLGPDPFVSFTLNGAGGVDPGLAGVKVTVDGTPAILLMSWTQQLNAILPFSAKTSGNADVVVEYNGKTSVAFPIPMVPAAAKLFAANAQGIGPAAALNQNYSVNDQAHPADKGSVVQLFGTGGGIVAPAVVEGGVASSTLSWVTLGYSATVNGVTSPLFYAGTAPGLVFGVYQFNVKLPDDVATGSANIVVHIGDSQTQPGVTVFVK